MLVQVARVRVHEGTALEHEKDEGEGEREVSGRAFLEKLLPVIRGVHAMPDLQGEVCQRVQNPPEHPSAGTKLPKDDWRGLAGTLD